MKYQQGASRRRRARLACALVATAGALSTVVAAAGSSTAAASAAPAFVRDPASLVNPIVGTSGGVDTFPGPDMPFGMMQWSPDTPSRPAGGGYEYNDTNTLGFSLTHISGPGCGAYGDVPILPTVGAIDSNPTNDTVNFSHKNETARLGYYSVKLANGVTTSLTDSTHSGIGTFAFPAGTQSNLLFKLSDSADTVAGDTAHVVGDDEVVGSVTAGQFCGAPTSWERNYTLHFDVKFSQPFTAHGTWVSPASGARRTAGLKVHGAPAATHTAKASTASSPDGLYVTFDTSIKQTVTAKVGISFTSDANAALNLRAEIPGWNFDAVRAANHNAWNNVLGRIQIAGQTPIAQTQFYTALYHALLHPNAFSDVNGQYMGFDGRIHTTPKGHVEYANYSGWDIYRSQVQLMAMVAPRQTSDEVRTMLDDYAQTGMMPKWNLGGGESYVMVGDPADGIIADAYAFGARDFNVRQALSDMIHEADATTNIRPGEATREKYGYLPYDGSYACCNFYGPVSTQLEYDTADYAIASLANSLGEHADYTKYASRAQDWQNTFNPAIGYLQAKYASGQWVPGFAPGTSAGFVEGSSAQYTPMVNFNLHQLITADGGTYAYNHMLDGLLSNLTHPNSTNADLSNEPSVEIPWEYDYTGEPYKTQAVVRQAQQQLYFDAPVGQDGNDDLGEMSSWYVWSELGMYPETPGTDTLVLGSPVFTRTAIHLGDGRTVTVDAPQAMPGNPYVQDLTVNGAAWNKPWLTFADLTHGATLDYDLAGTPNTSWGAAPAAAPPSDGTGEHDGYVAATGPAQPVVKPGGSTTASVQVRNISAAPITVRWQASTTNGATVTPASGTLTVKPGDIGSAPVTIVTGSADGWNTVTFTGTDANGMLANADNGVRVAGAVAGEMWPYYDNVGVTQDGTSGGGGFDGGGWTYSANALAALKITPGSTVTSNGVTYTWPNVANGTADNVEAIGQTIPLALPAGSGTLGLLGAANNAASNGATGTLTITYTDGSTQQAPIVFSDWTLGAGSETPAPGDTVVANTPYRDNGGGRQNIHTYLFAFDVKLTAGKTVASVTMPGNNGSGLIHVFAFGSGS
jgi:predicted alpha-1,2-mannosidase